ncbi:hypothetical protein RT99_06215 [Flavobacterium sp. MEB061]|uniref:tetratricopeptide repeat protein n=1 Tax=Flavobacterium sp. MEB061 TaxID=1587524 RepID=UPI0005ABDA91|nr:tetratricopeptide repeat protein [Flavobacterium sp. MEB061]KIQ22694.1 hypothetical protein RT99_06215 [Flavobacterium sp. MEB061]
MNVTDYTYLINKPDAITEKQTEALGNVLIEFPYFQSARALRLKGLFNQNSFKYNYALKVTAAHTADRSILFDFITSETFTSIQNDFYDKKLRDLLNINVLDSEVVSPDEIKKSIEVRIDPIEQSILTSIKQATSNVFEDSIKTEEKTVEPIIEETKSIVFEEVIKTEEKPEDSIEDADVKTIEEKKSVVNEEIINTEDIKEDVLILAEETEPAVFEEVKTHNESIDSIKEETIVIPVKETKHTFFEEVVDDDEVEDIKENFDPVIEKPVSTIEEIAPVVFEEPKKHTEIRIDPIEESIYKSIKEATTVIFEESKPAEKEAAAIIVDTPKITEQHKEIASVVFEEVKITEEKPNEVIPTILDQPTTVEESPKEVINFILEEPIFIEESKEIITDSIEESIIEKNILKTQFEETVKIAEENLEIGKPLDFSVKEKHSFQEWLQLARPEPIDRTNEIVQEDIKTVEENTQKVERTPEPIKQTVPETEIVEDEKKKKAELIDKFIETNPKISPIKSDPITLPPIQFNINQEDNSYLMTETLARVYLEQKKYTKAIQAYEILILKYPEKISFFADRISDIKILQQNNNNK